MAKIKTYKLTFWLPLIVSTLALSLLLFQSVHNYKQNVKDIYAQNKTNLEASAWFMSRTFEYHLARDDYDEVKREISLFALGDNVLFGVLVSPDYIIELSSSFSWEGKKVQSLLPEVYKELVEHTTGRHHVVSHDDNNQIMAIVPVLSVPDSSELRSITPNFLVLKIDLSRELNNAASSAVDQTIPTLLVIMFCALLLIGVIRKFVLKPLQILEQLGQNLLGGKQLSNPMSGDTEQSHVAQVLVDAGNQINRQLFELQDKEQRISITLDSIGDAVIVTDEYGLITRMNMVASALTGWSQEDALGQALPSVFDIYNASSLEKVANPVEQVLATKQIVELANHTVLVSKTGERFHISDSAAPIRFSSDKPELIHGVILVFQNVTTQYKLREKLSKNATFLNNILDISPGVTYVLDIVLEPTKSFPLSYVNNAVETYTGDDAETWLNQADKWLERIHPDDVQQVKDRILEAIHTKKHCKNEFRIQHNDGHYVHVRDSMVAVFNEKGIPHQIIGVAHDITDEKISTQQQHFMGEILERSLNEIIVYDADSFIFTQANKGARQNLGYTLDELKQRSVLDIKPEFTLQEFEQFVAPLKTGEKDRLEFDTLHKRKDGSTYPVMVDLQYDRLSEQAVFVAIIDDITERKFIERELKEERSLLKGIVDSTPDLIFCKDAEGVYIRCNSAFEQFFGASEKDILGKTDFDFVDKNTAQNFRDKDTEMMNFGVTQINEELVTYPDGNEVLLETLKTPLKTESNTHAGVLGISRNITEQRHAELALQVSGQVFEYTTEGIFVTDSSNRFIQVNPAFTTITGYSQQDVIGKKPNILQSGLQSSSFYAELLETLYREGIWTGDVLNKRKNGEIYPQRLSISTIKDLAGNIQKHIALISDISSEKKAQEHIEFLAQHDVLTSLPNRALLNDRIHQAIVTAERQHQSIALLFLDLDRFKFVNDSLGHAIGDELLIEVSKILLQNVRKEDTVSRTGGDEFTILLVDTYAQGAAHVAQNLIDAISQPFNISNHQLFVTLSIGISLYPDNGDTEQLLSQKADTAMYRAKQNGRNQYQFFTEEMHTQMLVKLELEKDLRFAQERNQFELVYQPQVSLDTNKIIGCEALIRWNHPEKGYISPMEFIPIAEESGLINSIGDWVLNTAILQIKRWKDASYDDLLVAVNLSGIQFNDLDLVGRVEELLQKHSVPASNLELEITESIAMNDIELTISQLQSFANLGIKLSLDDFGTGYSSLSYLKKFPINKLKIDQSFVFTMLEDEDNSAIVDAVITLAKALRLETIAEGVETKQQLDALKEKGCDQMQGYYFSKPIPAEQFNLLMESVE